ncbi:MAG: SRPBCC family protein [Chloroflexota bacterium]
MTERRITGKTKHTGFQVGVRRTFPVSLEQAWQFLTSREGIEIWLGDVNDFHLVKGEAYHAKDGANGEVRVVNRHENIRITWQPGQWRLPSTIQVRLIPSGRDKTVVSFHQEKLPDATAREQMLIHWTSILDELQKMWSAT